MAQYTRAVPASSRGAHADVVDLDVVGVAVAAALVVGGEHVGLLAPQDLRESLGRLVEIGGREGAVGIVRRLAVHAGVVVAEELDARDAEHVGRPLTLDGATVAERFGRCEHAVVDFAELAARREHGDHAVTVVGGARHGAAGDDRLVVGMGVEADDRRGHEPMQAHAIESGASGHWFASGVTATFASFCRGASKEHDVDNGYREMVQR